MKVTCVGMDPAGLYLGILLKRRDPSHLVRFVDGSPQPSAPATIICNPIKPRLTLADAETLDAIKPAIVSFDRVSIDVEGRAFETKGLKYASIDRTALVQALKQRASEVGCVFERRTLTDDDRRSDLVVAADGPDSETRTASGLSAEISRSSNRTVVFQSAEPTDAVSYSFRTTEHGIFHAWRLPRGPNGSSVIVETPAETLRVSGLDKAPPECIIALCRKLFSLPLDRIVAAADGSIWESFATVRNRTWHAGNVVLLGRAAYTSHGSVGLDLRSQLEDAEALAEHLSSGASIADALTAFEAARRPKAESLQRASDASRTFFEHVRRYRGLPFEQFCFSLLTSSMRLTYARIEKAAPDLVRTIDTLLAGTTPASNRPPPPMFAPIRLRGLTIPNRVVVSPMCQYSATDGTVSDWHLVHLGSRAIGGAGLIIAEMTDVLPEGRISLHCAGMYKAEHVRRLEARHRFRACQQRVQDRGAARACRPQGLAHPLLGRPQVARRSQVGAARALPDRIRGRPPGAARDDASRHGQGARCLRARDRDVGRSRLRHDRAALRARLPDVVVHLAAHQPAHRRIRRLAREPHALPARSVQRGARRLAGATSRSRPASPRSIGSRAAQR